MEKRLDGWPMRFFVNSVEAEAVGISGVNAKSDSRSLKNKSPKEHVCPIRDAGGRGRDVPSPLPSSSDINIV